MHGLADEWIANRVRWKLTRFTHQPSDILFFDIADDGNIGMQKGA